MQALFEGIYSHYNTNFSGAHALAGRLYLAESPQNVAMPFVVYNLLSGVPEYWLNADEMQEFVIQFSIFTDDYSAANVNTHYASMIGAFDNAAITVSGWAVVYCMREFASLTRDIEGNIWHYVLRYRIVVE